MLLEFQDEIEALQSDPPNQVAAQIIANYNASIDKEPDKMCFEICKQRLLEAYQDVMGHSLYDDLPESMDYDAGSPKMAFDRIFNSASGNYNGWTHLPEEFRGKGAAGAMAHAGMAELKTQGEIWEGELDPGAVMQVWRSQEDYESVVRGNPNDVLGHSFIFLSYERDEQGNITGMNIADQGYQSGEPLTESSWGLWFGANLTVSASQEEGDVVPADTLSVPTVDTLQRPVDSLESEGQ